MNRDRYRRLAVVGVGLIGGSVAAAARRRGLAERVVGVVRSAERIGRVEACDLVDEVTADLAAGCRDADLVVIATPVGTIAALALEAAEHASADAVLTDGGSTKAGIVAHVTRRCPRFVGAHPLAGDHRTGPEAARHDLFDGAVTVLTPTDDNPDDAVGAARRFWEALGSRVVTTTPERHDELLALTSHVPHVAAAAVAATTPADAMPLAATGWADTTRVAGGSPDLWREILLANPGPIAAGLRRLATEIEAYAAALDRRDADALQRLLTEGKRRRDALGS
ncbi:prephenate dehydrogenase/arogenate dehydrogenase family protein [Botrimarina sp.]|uniref:prephenate dehydrogenase n=1 Tax=Botrimarina sp. TaxID=2795802 RepID=UPI0032EFFEE0